jgi:hypothetical protein
MAKSEIFNEYHTGGGLAEIERPPTKQRVEAPNIKVTPSVKTPLTFHAASPGDSLAKSDEVQFDSRFMRIDCRPISLFFGQMP